MLAYTAHSSCMDKDRMHIGVQSKDELGMIFSPTWELQLELSKAYNSYFIKLASLESLRQKDPGSMGVQSLEFETQTLHCMYKSTQEGFAAEYRNEMRRSYSKFPDKWKQVLTRFRVIFLCDCANSEACHRTILARDIMPKLGVSYCFEIVPTLYPGANNR